MNRLLAALALLATGCATTPPPPVVIRETVPLPEWATAPLPRPRPADGTVGALGASHDARGAVLDYADCRSLLIRRIERGEAVDPKTCETAGLDP